MRREMRWRSCSGSDQSPDPTGPDVPLSRGRERPLPRPPQNLMKPQSCRVDRAPPAFTNSLVILFALVAIGQHSDGVADVDFEQRDVARMADVDMKFA